MFQNPYLQQIPFFILVLAVWYFFFFRPGGKEKESKKSFFDNLKVGDPIVTAGGIHGVITDLQAQQVMIRISNTIRGPQMKIEKEAISIEMTQKTYPKEVVAEKSVGTTKKGPEKLDKKPRKKAAGKEKE